MPVRFENIVKDESAIWKGADKWHQLRRKLTALDLKRTGPAEDAGVLVAECDSLQKNSGPFGDQLLGDKVVGALRLIASRDSQGNMRLVGADSWRVLSRKTISRAYLIETNKGAQVLHEGAPDFAKASAQVDYYTTTTGTQTDQ